MLDTSYNIRLNFSIVEDLNSFYKENLPEMPRIRSFVGALKLLFVLPTDRVVVEVAEGERIYKIKLLQPNVKKTVFGWFVYIPQKNRLDLYSAENYLEPVFQWKNKKLAYASLPELFLKAGIEKLFSKVINIVI